MKAELKNQAINLRKNGYSYSEILKTVPVAKSTLSLWLRSVGLSIKQKQRLTRKKLLAAKRGGIKRREWRMASTERIKENAHLEITKRIKQINNRDLWLMGTMLYWAEGSKEKDYKPGQGVIFGNSDPYMIKIFLKWLKISLRVQEKNLQFSIYIHETHRCNIEKIKEFWADITGFPMGYFDRIYFKKHVVKSNRRNTGASYHGLLRIRVRESSILSRRIIGWIEGIYSHCGMV